ncbi:MAG: protein kinase [Bryobacterales bacterium]|nr:protein kinase [Bryobacterales bacterium]
MILPSQLSHYRLLDKLGEGGMGVVFKAQDLRLDRTVALKILPPDRVADQEKKLRFVQEAKAASALNHPNIVTIHEIGQDQGMDFLVMEWVDGQTLEQVVPGTGLRVPELLRLGVQIADGIAAAHAAGVAHRDIKPSNIMVSGAGHVKILDFGLAKLTERSESSAEEKTRPASPRTAEGAILGTVAYMSPEQAEGRKVDLRTDIFSFGALLYEMACGRRAFAGESPAATLGAVIHKEPRPLGELAPELPMELRRLIERCLRKDRTRRLQSMADVKVALLDLKEESDTGRLTAASAAAAQPRRGWLLPAACGVALLAGVGGTLAWTSRGSKADASFNPVLTQLTRDSGLTYQPALSPDGKLLAYASNRADPANLDIWVQQLAGGQPVRLTRHTAADTRPLFSPDGTVIYFLSERPEGSIWAIPALGGEERLVYNRRMVMHMILSPDGKDLIFNPRLQMGEPARASRLSTVTGAVHALDAPLHWFVPIAWMAEGETLIGIGRRERALTSSITDGTMYAASLRGDTATELRLPSGEPLLWNGRGVRLRGGHLFLGEGDALTEYSLSRSWKLEGPVRRWARFPGATLQFDVAGESIVAATLSGVTDLWSLPVRANEGKVTGPPERLTNDEAVDWWPSLSASGRLMLYTSDRRGSRDVWARDLVTGKESQVTATPVFERRATVSPDGRRMAYEVSGTVSSIYVREVAGGEPKLVCKACGLPTWTPDSARVVYWDSEPIRFHTFDLTTGARKPLVSHPKLSVQNARVSPDGRWVSFHLPDREQTTRLYIAPLHDGSAGPATEWMDISGGRPSYTGWWAPDGNLLYFLASQSLNEIHAQRLDPATKQRKGEPFVVFAAPPGFVFSNVGVAGYSLSQDRMVLSMQQSKANLWLIEPPPAARR